MKKLFLMITLVAGITVVSYAQVGAKSPEQRAAQMTKALQRKLNLTADQANQVHAIMFAQASGMDSLKNVAATGNRKTVRFAKLSIMQTTDQKLSSILNPDQLKGYEDWKAMRKEKAQEKKNGTTAPAAPMPATQG